MLKNFIQNWKSGITVALVNIPLSIALAIASGATPTQGIITAFWAGLLVGILGGSKFNITGPTGALSGILVSFALVNGYETLPIIAILSGIMIFICYILHLEKYIIFIPRSVVYGFTLGVAMIIGLGQLDNALGLINIPKTENLLENVWTSLQNINMVQWQIVGIFSFVTIFILAWNKKFPQMPGAIIAAGGGILLAYFLQVTASGIDLLTIADKYPHIRVSLFENNFGNFSREILLNKQIWIISIATSIIAILETLLSGKIADNMTATKFNSSKEVFGLAIGNIGSGIMGGIPATAALARTALNIKSGARSNHSAILSSIFVGLITIFLFHFFQFLPLVLVAAILITVAIGMVEKHHFIFLIDNERTSFYLSIFVAIITVLVDPIAGILIGSFIALLFFVNRISNGQTEILIWKDGKLVETILKNEFIKKDRIDSDVIIYKITGSLTYINMPAHLEAIKKIMGNKYVIISLRHAFYADLDGIEYLRELIEILKQNNDKILLTGVNSDIEKQIVNHEFYQKKLIEGKTFKRTSEALNFILKQI